MNRRTWRWLGAAGGAAALVAAAVGLNGGPFHNPTGPTETPGRTIGAPGSQESGPATPTNRVLLEYFRTATLAREDDPAVKLISQLDPYLDRSQGVECAGPLVPGRTGRPILTSGVLKGDTRFFDFRNVVEELCKRESPKDGSCAISGVFGNPGITPILPEHGVGEGTFLNVKQRFRDGGLAANYGKGSGVFLAIVDEGFSLSGLEGSLGGNRPAFDAGNSYVLPGTMLPTKGGEAAENTHGTMVAFDALLGAPEATLLDIRIPLMTSDKAMVGGAVCAFEHLADVLQKAAATQPMVVVNSWAVSTPQDIPLSRGLSVIAPCVPGDKRLFEGNASVNACHPINRAILRLTARADVVFAAGNNSSPLNGNGECVPGKSGSILGVNSNPHVLTVAAATLSGQPLLKSSVGPGQLDPNKPDLAAYSGFQGSGVYGSDSGTSAAAAVAAGVVAAMRTQEPALTPTQLKKRLIDHATAPQSRWACRLGAGLIQVPPLPAGGVSP